MHPAVIKHFMRYPSQLKVVKLLLSNGMNWGCIEIVPSDANEPGILASVASIIAETGISIRQSMVDDPDLTESPKLYVITDEPVPSKIIPTLMECKGVKSLTIH